MAGKCMAMVVMDPWGPLGIFILSSMLMGYRLNAMEKKGLEGTVLGTLVMPYASGFPNLAFALSMGRQGGSGSIIIENCLVNNNIGSLGNGAASFLFSSICRKTPKVHWCGSGGLRVFPGIF